MFYDPNDLTNADYSDLEFKNSDGTAMSEGSGNFPVPVNLVKFATVEGKLPLFPQAIFLCADFHEEHKSASQRDYNSTAAGHPDDFVS